MHTAVSREHHHRALCRSLKLHLKTKHKQGPKCDMHKHQTQFEIWETVCFLKKDISFLLRIHVPGLFHLQQVVLVSCSPTPSLWHFICAQGILHQPTATSKNTQSTCQQVVLLPSFRLSALFRLFLTFSYSWHPQHTCLVRRCKLERKIPLHF